MTTWGIYKVKKADTLALPRAPKLCPRLHMRALEPRVLLDAAAVETAVDVAGEAVHSGLADAYLAAHRPEQTSSDDANEQSPSVDADLFFPDDAEDSQTDQLKQIAFVAADVPDILTLVAALPADAEIVLLENSRDGVEQIVEFLDGRSDIDAIHLISHGEEGVLRLGNTELTAQTMAQTYRSQLAKIGETLSLDADIIVYGCDFAGGETGREAANLLANLLNADVAASIDTTGHSSLGGDWDLEFKTGEIEAETFDAGDAWLGTLPIVVLESHEVDFADVDHEERVGANRKIGQTFTHGSSGSQYQVNQIDLVLQTDNDPDIQNIIVAIREDYDGPALATGSLSSAGLTSSLSWQSITLDSPILLDGDTDYVFTVETDVNSGGGPGGRTVELAVEHDEVYAGGEAIDRRGDVWDDHYVLFRLMGDTNSDPVITSFGGGVWVFPNLDENQTFVGTVTATDPDAGDTLTFSIAGGTDAALFTIDPNTGDLSFVNPPDYENPIDGFPTNGIYTVIVDVSDGNGGTDTQTISVVINDINDVPVATGGSVTTPEDTPYVFSSGFSYLDDDGAEAQSITVSNLALAGGTLTHSGGTVTVANGMTITLSELADLTFTPALNSTSEARFDYAVNDIGAGVVTAPMVITVTPVNDAPTSADIGVATTESVSVNGAITMNDVDVGDTPEATLGTVPMNGSAVVNLDGTFTYTPNAGFSGADSFTIIVTDDAGLTTTATVDVGVTPVNDAPVAFNDSVNVPENVATPLSLTLPIDPDDVAANLTVTITQAPTAVQGTLTYTLDGGGTSNAIIATTMSVTELATIIFTPVGGYSGSVDDFIYVVTDDDGLSDAGSVGLASLTINGVNDAPDANDDAVSVTEDTATLLNPTIPTDVDDAAIDLTVLVTQLPRASEGALSYTLDGGGTISAVVGTTMSVAEFSTLTFTPQSDYVGPVRAFTYRVTDDDDASDAGSDGSVAISIVPVNDAPVGSTATVTTLEDTPVNGVVIMNDPDAGDTPEATLGTGPANGSVVVNLDGTYTYTPDPDYAGPDSFTVVVTDDAGLTDTVIVNITVTAVDDAPSGSATMVMTLEDTPINGAVIMSDPDAGDTPEAKVNTAPSNGTVSLNSDGTYVYTPNPDFAGLDSFTVIVTDDAGLIDTVTVNVTVTPVNDAPSGSAPPVTTPEDTPVGGTITMTDPDVGDTPEATLGTGPSNGSVVVNLDGTYTYTPDPDYVGPDSFEVIVTDDAGLTDTVTVNVTVTPVNDAPTGTAPPVTTPEDTPVGGTVTTTDPDTGDTPEATLGTGPVNGSVVVNLDGTYTYTPDPDYVGPDSFEVIVTDDAGLTDTVTVNVTVTPVNDAPTGTAPPVTTPEDTPVGGTVTTTDPDTGDTPEATLGTGPVNGSVVVNLDGTYTYTPDPDYVGPDSFEVIVTDDAGLTDTVTVTVTVTPVNDAPIITSNGGAPTASITVNENQTAVTTVFANDIDLPTDILTYSITGGSSAASFTIDPNTGELSFVDLPDYENPGDAIFGDNIYGLTVAVSDGNGGTDSQALTVIVEDVNEAPTGAAPAITTPEDTAVVGTVTMSDPDAGDTAEAILGTGPSNGSVVVSLDGTYTYTPDPNYAGPDSFTVVVTDDAGLTDTVTVDVTATPVNDAPIATGGSVSILQGYSHVFTIADFGFYDTENDALQSVTLSNVSLAGGTLTYSNGTISVTNGTTITRADLVDLTFASSTGSTAQPSFEYTVNDSNFGTVSASMTIATTQSSDPDSSPTEPDTSNEPDTQPDSDEPEADDSDPLFDPIELDGTSGTTAPPQLPVSSPPVPVVVQPSAPPVALPVEEAEEPLPLPIAPEFSPEPPEKLTTNPTLPEPAKAEYKFVPVNRQAFSNDLKQSGEEVRKHGEFFGTDAAKVSFAFTSLLTVGGASFVLRGGALAAALMSTVPAWGRYDPISIVTGRKDETEDDEESDADTMLEFIESARARVKEGSFL